jgi:hypothetical protein
MSEFMTILTGSISIPQQPKFVDTRVLSFLEVLVPAQPIQAPVLDKRYEKWLKTEQ